MRLERFFYTIVQMIVREAGMLLALGIAAGVVLSAIAASAATTLLYELAPRDPATVAAAIVLLALAASVASYLPARRAARVDPMVALRCE